jgi:hypothetical protein
VKITRTINETEFAKLTVKILRLRQEEIALRAVAQSYRSKAGRRILAIRRKLAALAFELADCHNMNLETWA